MLRNSFPLVHEHFMGFLTYFQELLQVGDRLNLPALLCILGRELCSAPRPALKAPEVR